MRTPIPLLFPLTHEDLKKILPVIEKLDKPTPQILIKANIVETTKTVARELGIMWGGYNKGTNISGNNESYCLVVNRTGHISILPEGLGGKGLGVNFPADSTATSSTLWVL